MSRTSTEGTSRSSGVGILKPSAPEPSIREEASLESSEEEEVGEHAAGVAGNEGGAQFPEKATATSEPAPVVPASPLSSPPPMLPPSPGLSTFPQTFQSSTFGSASPRMQASTSQVSSIWPTSAKPSAKEEAVQEKGMGSTVEGVSSEEEVVLPHAALEIINAHLGALREAAGVVPSLVLFTAAVGPLVSAVSRGGMGEAVGDDEVCFYAFGDVGKEDYEHFCGKVEGQHPLRVLRYPASYLTMTHLAQIDEPIPEPSTTTSSYELTPVATQPGLFRTPSIPAESSSAHASTVHSSSLHFNTVETRAVSPDQPSTGSIKFAHSKLGVVLRSKATESTVVVGDEGHDAMKGLFSARFNVSRGATLSAANITVHNMAYIEDIHVDMPHLARPPAEKKATDSTAKPQQETSATIGKDPTLSASRTTGGGETSFEVTWAEESWITAYSVAVDDPISQSFDFYFKQPGQGPHFELESTAFEYEVTPALKVSESPALAFEIVGKLFKGGARGEVVSSKNFFFRLAHKMVLANLAAPSSSTSGIAELVESQQSGHLIIDLPIPHSHLPSDTGTPASPQERVTAQAHQEEVVQEQPKRSLSHPFKKPAVAPLPPSSMPSTARVPADNMEGQQK